MNYKYNPKQFDAAVKFIAKKNRYFKADRPKVKLILENLIKEAIKEDKRNIKEDVPTYISTGGFVVVISYIYTDTSWIDIYVDPSVSKGYYEEDIAAELL
jgi:hypothetical protein